MRRSISILLVMGLVLCLLPLAAIAETYNIGDGDITINAADDGNQYVTQAGKADGTQAETSETIITGESKTTGKGKDQVPANTVTITAADGATANVTFNNLSIDNSAEKKDKDHDPQAAVLVKGEGDVNINLVGTNTFSSAEGHAGIEKESAGELTIADGDSEGTGELTANGGKEGAGIGGGKNGDGTGITIEGGEITANGGKDAAGIGGGKDGDGTGITIEGGEITANGGEGGAGIGGGKNGDGTGITITDGDVTANGGSAGKDKENEGGAGIGGGKGGDGTGITIEGGTVEANGGAGAAGIGGGQGGGDGSNITISGGEVTAVGGSTGKNGENGGGAGIGGGVSTGGHDSDGGDGTGIEISGGTVVATGGTSAAGIGGGGAKEHDGTAGTGNVTISGDAEVSAAGGAESSKGNANDKVGAGAAIGNGGSKGSPVSGSDEYEYVTEGALNTEGLYTTGSVSIYDAGTDTDGISDPNTSPAALFDVITGNVEPPVEEEADEENEFLIFCQQTAKRIQTAASNSTLEIDGRRFPGFMKMVFNALAARPDVALNVRCIIDGKVTEVKVPAGFDFSNALGSKSVLTFSEIAKLVG